MEYKKRIIDSILKSHMEAIGATLIVGPKGCGKTTTAKQFAKTVIEFQRESERDNLLAFANNTPEVLLDNPKPILFDEWQDAPKIWGAIRTACDDNPEENGSFLLTGSTSKSVNVSHTGTLRISTLEMYPMSLYETGESNGTISLMSLFNGSDYNGCVSNMTRDDIIFSICRGGWPKCILNKTQESKLLISKILFKQIYEKDISSVDNIKRNPEWARKILISYSRNICTLADTKVIYEDVKSTVEIGESTFFEYLSALKKLYIIDDVEAWCPSIRSKTAIRSSVKRNFIDPSLAVAALGISPMYFNKDYKTLGFLFESLCIRDLKVYTSKYNGKISYYHDRYGLEADAVLHLEDGRYALIEVKFGEHDIDEGAKHLCEIERLIKEYNEKEKQVPLRLPDLKIVLTGTKYGYKRDDGVFVIPIGCLKD